MCELDSQTLQIDRCECLEGNMSCFVLLERDYKEGVGVYSHKTELELYDEQRHAAINMILDIDLMRRYTIIIKLIFIIGREASRRPKTHRTNMPSPCQTFLHLPANLQV